jgi:protein-L-isoaspartate O-methyltransferase
MIVPVGPERGQQALVQVDRRSADGTVETRVLMGVRYVPLVRGVGESEADVRDL